MKYGRIEMLSSEPMLKKEAVSRERPAKAPDETDLLRRLKYFLNPIDGRYEDLRNGRLET
jgi:hypothetical protein